MWTCPKCGRTFKRQEQSHYCGKAPETVDEYIAAQPEEVQEYLKKIREAICAALPEAEERISWSMPTFWSKHNIIQFALRYSPASFVSLWTFSARVASAFSSGIFAIISSIDTYPMASFETCTCITVMVLP